MACIDREFCVKCDKVTEHMSYCGDADCPSIPHHCTECVAREALEKMEARQTEQEQKAKEWSEMTLEEKVENLNTRLRSVEVSGMTF